MASKKVFLDSSALYAFIDRADPNHTVAIKTIEQFSLNSMQLYTSLQVVQDTFSTLNNQLGSIVSMDFLQVITESSIEIIYPQKSDFLSAHRLIKLNRNKSITLKEAICSVIMEKKGITSILTFTYWHNLLGSQPYLSRG